MRLRAGAQRLTVAARRKSRPEAVLRDVCGLQAQDLGAAWLGVRARSAGLFAHELDAALNEERSIVRTWLMRGTLHVVAAEDLRWLLAVLGPIFAHGGGARHAELGLDPDLKARGVKAIKAILSDTGPLTRYELVQRLRRRGISLDPKTQAPIHLIRLAALQGVICLGPEQAKPEPTYVLLDDWVRVAAVPSTEAALGELARRYFRAFGPATLDDLATWSGLPLPQVRTAVAQAKSGLSEVSVGGQSAWMAKSRLTEPVRGSSDTPAVRLLPTFDSYLLGYRSRDLAVPAPLRRRLQPGGGWIHPAVVADGRAVAAWALRRVGVRGQVSVEPFEKLNRTVAAGIEAEVRDIGRFLALKVTRA